MPIVSNADRPLADMMPGVRRRTLLWGETMLFAEIHLEEGGVVPLHDHVYEQIGYCIEGTFDLKIGDVVHTIEPGNCWCVPSGVPHEATATSRCFLIEAWSPARDDYKD
ncbi:MAG: cupin domain-containing protein [Chloroflexi bacterium]|nr:cupin domain-containing protein [Chloroflexota bacterium]